MAHIWSSSAAGEWQPVALAAEACALPVHGLSLSQHALPPSPTCDGSTAVLRRAQGVGDDAWALLSTSDAAVLVNGLPVAHGIVILADRDEIRFPSPAEPTEGPANPVYFSTERLAVVTTYPAGGRRGSCPRCKQSLTAGESAVRCPGCGLWHHATEALPCWTYGEHCAACPQPTTLDAGFQWTPEDL